MMKMKIALVACILLVSSLAVLASENAYVPQECCDSLYEKRLKKDNVVTFKHTDKMCALKAVIFTMKAGTKICVNPNLQWVKNIITDKESE